MRKVLKSKISLSTWFALSLPLLNIMHGPQNEQYYFLIKNPEVGIYHILSSEFQKDFLINIINKYMYLTVILRKWAVLSILINVSFGYFSFNLRQPLIELWSVIVTRSIPLFLEYYKLLQVQYRTLTLRFFSKTIPLFFWNTLNEHGDLLLTYFTPF